MKNLKLIPVLKKGLCYVLGLLTIALGINIAKLSALGISPVSSIPRACEVIWGLSLGNTTMVIYCCLIVLQIIVLRKKFRLINLLGIAVTFLFSSMIDLTGTDPNAAGHLLLVLGVAKPATYIVKLLYLLISIVVVALGVFLYLRPGWIPMPAEGLAAAIAQATGKPFGDCKTVVDCSMIFIALLLQIICLGGLKSFVSDTVVVREGTVVSALAIGQIVKFFSKKLGSTVDKIIK